jgi:hypothetical protein
VRSDANTIFEISEGVQGQEEGGGVRIKNWKRFQHFKDRRPIWIKLYRDLIDDLEWYKLDPLAAKTLITLWIIASESEGELPCMETLAFRLRIKEKEVESILSKLSHWVEGDDINLISTSHGIDIPEKRREENIKKRREEACTPFVIPPSIRMETWLAFEDHRKKLRKPMTNKARNLIFSECEKIGGDPNDLLEQSILRGWTGVFPVKVQNVGTFQQVPTPKKKSPPGLCRCGKPATTKIGDETGCFECMTNGQ